MRLRGVALVVALACAWAAPAAADDPESTKAAKEHYKRATRHMAVGAYAAAVDEYREAYRLFPDPRMHFNLGQALRLKGGAGAEAIEHYQKFIAAFVAGRDVEEAHKHVAALSRELERERAAHPMPPPVETTPSAVPPPAPASTPKPPAPPPQAPHIEAAPAVTSPTRPPPRRRWPIWVGVTVAGLVVAAGVTTAAVLLTRPDEMPTFTENLR